MNKITLPENPHGLCTLNDATRRILDSGDEPVILEAAGKLLGESTLLRVEKQGFYVYYHGYISAPDITHDTDELQYFYVNGRYVREKTLYDSVKAAYKKMLPPGQHPKCCLFLSIKPYRLDEVEIDGENIVRFYDPYNVGSFCRDAVIEALRHNGYQ